MFARKNLPSLALSVASRLDEATSTGLARVLGWAGFYPGVVGFGGYASQSRARVLARVIMEDRVGERSWLTQRRGWRQFFDAQVPFQPVLVTCGQAQKVVFTDGGGYVDIELEGHGLEPGWQVASIQPLNAEDVQRMGVREGDRLYPSSAVDGDTAAGESLLRVGKTKDGRVLGRIRAAKSVDIPLRVIGDDERYGVVSDIDDTIIVSMIPRLLTAAKHALMERVSDREAVPGMAGFLRRVARFNLYPSGQEKHTERKESSSVVHGRQANALPVMYLSTGPWNLVPGLREFLRRTDFPMGAFLMTDFGPSNTGWFRSGVEHKKRELRRLASTFPNIQWILVGDDGQHDPEIYAEFAREFPKNVALIAIRSLSQLEQLMAHGTLDPISVGELEKIPDQIPRLYGEDGFRLGRAAAALVPQPPDPQRLTGYLDR